MTDTAGKLNEIAAAINNMQKQLEHMQENCRPDVSVQKLIAQTIAPAFQTFL